MTAMMNGCRFLFSVLAITIGVLVVEPFSHSAIVFAQSFEEAARLDQQALKLDREGHHAEAEQLYKRALAFLEKAYGPDHPHVAIAANNLAEFYKNQGRYAEAEPLYKRSLAIREKALGSDHPNVVIAVNNLAALYNTQGRHEEAEQLYKHSLAISEKAPRPDSVEVGLLNLDDLAGLYFHQGRYAEAEPLFKRSLGIREKALGADHPSVAPLLNNLAVIYGTQRRYAEAEPLYKRSLAITEKALGPDHPDVAKVTANLGSLYVAESRDAEAEPLLKRSLAITEKALGPDHPDVVNLLNDLARLCNKQGRFEEAEQLFKRALAIRDKAPGPDQPFQDPLYKLAEFYQKQGRYSEAAALLLGSDRPYVPIYVVSLAMLYEKQGRYADAEPLYKHALAIREKTLGADHPEVAVSLNRLGELYEKQGRDEEAEQFYKRALETLEKTLGPDGQFVPGASALEYLVPFYEGRGRYADALPIVRHAIDERIPSSEIFSILQGSQRENLISEAQSFADSYHALQSSSSSAAAKAKQYLAQRLAVGSGELAELVRRDQDLSNQEGEVKKPLADAFSRPSDLAKAGIRQRLTEIGSERKKLWDVLEQQFPNYVALANPKPLTLQETQDLLGDDEAVVAFYIGKKNYAWVVTRTAADWMEIPTSAKMVDGEEGTFGPIAEKLAGKTRLSILADGAPTSTPVVILITSDPQGKKLKDQDWLIKSNAVTILPSIYSLKSMRTQRPR
jgi:tetratricopeptide (TPR) repeat protein